MQVKSALFRLLSPSGRPAKIGTLLKKGSYQYSFTSLGAGPVTISWYYVPKGAHVSKGKAEPVLVATGKASFSKAGTVKLAVKLNAQGKQLLRRAKSLKLTAKGIYTPTGKDAVSTTKTFTLKR